MNDRSPMRRWFLSLAIILTVLVAVYPAFAAPPKTLDVNERFGHHLYLKAVPPNGVVNDGLVAVYSAQSPVLGLQGASWQPGQTFAVSRHELVTSTTVFQAIGNLIASW